MMHKAALLGLSLVSGGLLMQALATGSPKAHLAARLLFVATLAYVVAVYTRRRR